MYSLKNKIYSLLIGKQILIPGIILLLLLIASQSVGQQQSVKTDSSAGDDITLKMDSLPQNNQVINILKKGFGDLFVSSAMNNGMNVEQLNPRAVTFVQDYINKFGKTMEDMRSWGRPYFDMMDVILTRHGLPRELKYLAVIESHLKSNVRSWAGAVGPWQFMPATARNFGLKVSRYYDERTDYYKSTHAASRYLTQLFTIYGDWLLVIAAYNGGPGIVNYAMRRAGSKDFWALQDYLPLESKNHVKKFIATHYIMEGQGGITTVTKEELRNLAFTPGTGLTKEELDNSRTQPISGRYNSTIVTRYLSIDRVFFNRYNPDFDNLVATNGSYELRLPNDKMDIFLAKRTDILSESMLVLLKPASDTSSMPKKAFH